jgi:hypothetical protein
MYVQNTEMRRAELKNEFISSGIVFNNPNFDLDLLGITVAEAVSHTQFGNDIDWAVRVGFEFMPQIADVDPQ